MTWRRTLAALGVASCLPLGLLLQAPAHGQISFRSAAVATPATPISHVGAGTADTRDSTSCGSISPPIPGGSVGDLLIALVNVREDSTNVSASAGWSTLYANAYPGSNDFQVFIFYRIATGSDALTVTLSSSCNSTAGRVARFANVDTAQPFLNVPIPAGNVVMQDTNNVDTGTETTVDANAMLLVASFTDNDVNITQDPAWSESFESVHNFNNRDLTLNLHYQLQTTAGAKSVSDWALSATERNIGIIFSLRPAFTGLRIDKPAGTLENDVMVASVAVRPPPAVPSAPITHVGVGNFATRDSSSCGSISPSIPAGSTGDVLIALANVQSDGASVATPSGWTLLYSETYSPSGNNFQAFIFYRIATGSDSLTITATGSCNTMGARVSRFANVDTSQPFLNVPIPAGNVVMQNSNNIDTGTETTVDAYAMLLVASFINDDNGITEGAGWSVSFEDAYNSSDRRDFALHFHYQSQTTAGAYSISDWSIGATDPNIGVIFSLRPLPGVPQPPVTITPPTGWTLVGRTDNSSNEANSLAVYIKVAGASEPASYTWGLSATSGFTGGIQSFIGVDTANPVDVQNGQTTASGLAHATPSVTTTVAETMLVTSHAFASAATWTSPSGMTQGFTVSSVAAPNAAGVSIQCNYVIQSSAAATGAKSATAGSDADVGNAHILALRPAVVPVPTPGSFNAFETSTAAGAITGVIRTRVSGSAFSLDVVVIESGAQLTGFTADVTVELLGNNTLGVPLDASNCPTASTVVQTVSPNPTITGGRSTVSFAAVPNSWRDVRVRVRWPTSSPTVTGCSTDNFAIRPESFSVGVTDTDWQSAGTGRTLNNTGASGGVVHKAGRAFTLTVSAAPGTATNYNGDPTVSALTCTLPTPCANGTLAPGTYSGGGTRVSNTATYSEAGAFDLTLVDQSFASVDSADGTPADCSAAGRYVCQSGGALAVGRFVPDRFAISSTTAPVFRTFDTAACAGGRSFTYLGQPFGYATAPSATVLAQNAAGGTTTNYRGALWKLTAASASQAFANAPVLALDPSQILAPSLSEIADSGTGTLGANGADKLAFVRNNATPSAPFSASLSLSWSVSDATEAGAGQGTISTTTPLVFSGIAFDSGAEFRYGRLRLGNANGSQLVPLPVPMEAQYWGYTNPPLNTVLGFITNAADHCTPVASLELAMSAFSGNLAACETALSGGGTLSSGRRTLLLAAPGNANDGSVLLTANLGAAAGTTCATVGGGTVAASGAGRAYLQGAWSGSPYDDNPTAKATFGAFKGSREVIFIRENF